ncbi:FAD/NAD(P)-binding domain-containing protein [Mollisia scopiformis]|uniref:FAD/NAD(P)-binding domain-containing protein n=1 Tax=Mollisia scopiformis TaxID=149040 RepID=A0A132BAE0_MOLSC|nr:FAD/NAD(P)-binding domain-containing protein [Mollisia scopiformis]KUJ09375.1 FAD/NAD(P)-binding domain-containing protein [Mollisia scopiformis]
MSPPRVLIIGCGVAGPAIALLLKRKGYSPIILEKVRQLGDVGGSLMLFPNGLKVLSLLGLSSLATETAPNLTCLRDISSNGTEIGDTKLPATWRAKYGQPACGVKRTALNLALKEACLDAGIPVLEGWKLKDIIETENSVTAIAEDGRMEEGAFLIGCDGIKSATRNLVLKGHGMQEEDTTFTNLTQAGGMSPTPSILKQTPGMMNWYGEGAHFIAYPISKTTTSWAITQRSNIEEVETWQQMSVSQLAVYKSNLLAESQTWCEPIQDLIKGSERLIKYGLFDRPQLEKEKWVSEAGRCVLIGDAAHPTSPHLGQGANQALEDCWHLARLLPDGEVEMERKTLKEMFLEFSGLRQPRTAALVRGARAQGERRVVSGTEECRRRDEALRRGWMDELAVEEKWESLLREPF